MKLSTVKKKKFILIYQVLVSMTASENISYYYQAMYGSDDCYTLY
jgi:hypothetical protein